MMKKREQPWLKTTHTTSMGCPAEISEKVRSVEGKVVNIEIMALS